MTRVSSLVATMLIVAAPFAVWPTVARAGSQSVAPAAGALDLNTASAAQLEELPGIGPKTAALIVEYRERTGGFKRIEDLMNVKGIGEKSFLRLKDLITVGPPRATERTVNSKGSGR